jgi:hypothetical protein
MNALLIIVLMQVTHIPQESVPFDKLESGEVSIIGKLGQEMGTVVEIDGTWSKRDVSRESVKEDIRIELFVKSVDGKKLSKPVQYDLRDIIRADGKHLEEKDRTAHLKVFERCAFRGIPPKALEIMSPRGIDRRFGIFSELVVIPDDLLFPEHE